MTTGNSPLSTQLPDYEEPLTPEQQHRLDFCWTCETPFSKPVKQGWARYVFPNPSDIAFDCEACCDEG